MDAQLLARKKDRDRLFALKPSEIDILSYADQYMRMRYEREVEAAWYVKFLKHGLNYKDAAIEARKEADKMVANWESSCTIYSIS
jgi:head-tail adaptor